MSITSTRVYGLDILKALCAFCVITIHGPFPGKIGICIEALSRIAVPIFFMITGFFYVDTLVQKKELAQMKKIFLLCFYSNALYFLWGLFRKMLAGGGEHVKSYLSQTFALKSLLKWFVFNQSPLSEHLWYLSAILYVLIIVYFLNRVFPDNSSRILLIAMPFLLLINLVFGNYSLLLFQRKFPLICTRNFLFVGIPYFALGYFLRERKKYLEVLRDCPIFLFSSALFFSLTTIIELFLVHRFGLIASTDHFISTIFLSILIFTVFTSPYWNKKMPVLYNIGRKHSVYVYIFHPIVISVLNKVANLLQIYEFYVYCLPIVVYIVTTLISILYIRTRASLTSKFNRQPLMKA